MALTARPINGMMDVGSPLKTALGTHDTTWVSNTKPGVGSGLDGIADLEEVATVNPSTFTGTQYNGRMDGDVTKKDRLSFIIYWAPNATTSYNGPARPSNFEYASDINNAFTALWDHTFSPTLLNEARASAVGYRYNLIAQNPQGTFGLPTDTFTGVGIQRALAVWREHPWRIRPMDLHLPGHCYQEPEPAQPQSRVSTESCRVSGRAGLERASVLHLPELLGLPQ